MQISSANILIAAQQSAKQAPQAKPVAKPFADALAGDGKGDSFAPLSFKQTAVPTAVSPQAQVSTARPGSQIDIRI